jgi:DNA-directed RNA polymerase subunit M
MIFCPKCGSILKPKTEKGKRILFCSCGYNMKDAQPTKIKEKVAKEEKEIQVVPEDEKILSKTEAECPKCHNKEAYYWLVQTRAGDEPETKFLKCVKCKHTWRDYS